MSRKPTLIFVAGAWHKASVWDKVTSLLAAKAFNCVPVTLPTTTSDPSATFVDDYEAIRNSITKETSQGNDVVVVLHSYGGAVGASSIQGLGRPKQTSPTTDGQGNVIGMVLIASGFMVTGKTFLEVIGGQPPPVWKIEDDFATIVGDPREWFYNDLPLEEGNAWVAQIQKQSLKAFTEGGDKAYAGWKDVPVWYLATKQDSTHPQGVQKMFVEGAKTEGADVTLREIDSSHSPMLSKPEETVEVIVDAVSYFVE